MNNEAPLFFSDRFCEINNFIQQISVRAESIRSKFELDKIKEQVSALNGKLEKLPTDHLK